MLHLILLAGFEVPVVLLTLLFAHVERAGLWFLLTLLFGIELLFGISCLR